MTDDQLTTFLNEFTRALFDPTAPLPALWPSGALGVFLIFASQIGAGIPLGVLMARDAGIPILVTAGLYAASDVLLAVFTEPLLQVLRWLGQRVEFIGRLGNRLARFSGAAGLQRGTVRGPTGLILFSFTVAPMPARAASEALGYGPIWGWTLAIIGDMGYFALVMASTLWVSSLFGDDRRFTIGAVLIGMWVVPTLIRRIRMNRGSTPATAARASSVASATSSGAAELVAARVSRRAVSHNGRRRRSTRRA